ncbi:SGNH/GDSL hydrolase family protein [uncultured Arcticibacterium sp.]|uniref:SGNH/GDSL hydrolase family protein n=1 Tax=uncultured Arcticibacterium sp. TaxID=2173042 RepID=UPI0030F73D4A
MKRVFYSLIIFIFTLLIAEVILLFFVKLPDPYDHLRVKSYSTGEVVRLQNSRNSDFAFLFRPNELFPMDSSVVTDIHINNFGFRHNDDVDTTRDEFSIYAIGGSTTQGYDYPYNQSWCQVVEQKLEKVTSKPINVYNGGTAGAAMFDHIALLQNRVIHLKPNMVILFSGVNDLNVLLGDNNLHRFDDIHESSELVNWPKLLLGKSAIFRLAHNARNKINMKVSAPANLEERKHRPIPDSVDIQFSDHLLPPLLTNELPLGTKDHVDFDYYKKMVTSFVGICKANEIPIIVMTQPTTWTSKDTTLQKYHWMNKNKEHKFSKEFMQGAMDRMNSDVVEIASKQEIPIITLDKEIPNNGEYFYDDCHFTPKGSVFVGETVARYISENNLIPIK